jgi:Flp pilus assembly protein TadD
LPARPRFWLAAFTICVLVLIAYGNSIGNGFVWDDHQQTVMNPNLKPGAPLAPIFTSDVRFVKSQPGQTNVYRPLQLLTYRIVTAWFGVNPAAFHACSVLFAMAGALAALWLGWLPTRRLGVAFSAAALFAVHPVHTEAVDWIAALPDLGCELFTLLAFGFFLLRREHKGKMPGSGWVTASLSLLAFTIALLWKETAVVFPALLMVYVLLLDESSAALRACRAAVESVPYWLVLAAYLAVRFRVLGSLATGPRSWRLTPLQFVLSAAHLLLEYWGKLLLPIQLSAYYVFRPIRSFADPRAIVTVVLGLASIAALVSLLRRAPLAAFAAVWVCLTLLPALNVNALGRNAFTERYLYLPSVGFCLLVTLAAAWLIGRLPSAIQSRTSILLLAAVVAGLTIITIERNPDWKDDPTLFSQTLERAPDAPFVHYMVAAYESEIPSEVSLAERNYREAISLASQEEPPDRIEEVTSYQGLGWLYANRSDYEQALDMLGRARQLAPDNPDADGEEGLILARAGRGAAAEPLLIHALDAQPNNENVLAALGLVARDEHHDSARAETLFKKALAAHLQDDDFAASLHNNLGTVYGDEDRYPAAEDEFREAIRISPSDPEYHVNLASSYGAMGQYAEAKLEAQTALRLSPNDPAALEILARLEKP